MASTTVSGLNYPSSQDLQNMYLRAIQYGYIRRGITANVQPGSAYAIQAKAFADQVAIALQNNQLALADLSPLSAVGDQLTALAAVYGEDRRAAVGSSGLIEVTFTGASCTIPEGYQCTAENGSKFQVIALTTLTASPGYVSVEAVEGGASSNLDPADPITWDAASVGNLSPDGEVGPDGLDGGADEDTDEELRARLLEALANPGVGGSWSEVQGWAEEATASVGTAFVYPAVRGPGSYDVAIVAEDGDRTLEQSTITLVSNYISARMPGNMSLNVTTVDPVEVDVTVAATLPLPVLAGGAGGGWRDAAPWPSFDAYVSARAGDTLTITRRSGTIADPVNGNVIAIWDPDQEELFKYEIVSFTGTDPGPWVCTVNNIAGGTGPAFSHINCYVSADCQNLEDYIDEIVAKFLTLGPGEKTSSSDILPRGLRKPTPDTSSPANITNNILSAVVTQHPEILDFSYGIRLLYATGTTATGPGIPQATADAPKIIVLKNLAIRKA